MISTLISKNILRVLVSKNSYKCSMLNKKNFIQAK